MSILNPKNIDVSAEKISIVWEDGHTSVYSAPLLRAACQCANCVSEVTGEPLIDKNKLAESNITLTGAEPSGRYALTLAFSDRHATGIYSYEWLKQLCQCEKCKKF